MWAGSLEEPQRICRFEETEGGRKGSATEKEHLRELGDLAETAGLTDQEHLRELGDPGETAGPRDH